MGDRPRCCHVKNKDDLLAGLRELIWAEIAAALPVSVSDAAWLRSLGYAIRDAGRRHPHAMPSIIAGTAVSPLVMLEAVAARFDRGGAQEPSPRLVNGIGAVVAFALGWALMISSGAVATEPETERQRILRVTRALPPDTADRLVETAIAVCACDVGAMFSSGLAAVISGCGLDDGPPRPRSRDRRAR